MFNSLAGTVTHKDTERVFLQSGSVEWELWTTGQSLSTLPAIGAEVTIFTYLHHREDVLRLYGFATAQEREVFLELIRVDSVGPRLALKVLSGIPANQFAAAVDAEDLPTLQAIPGLGQKTAQKIVLRLKGRLTATPVEGTVRVGVSKEDIVAALTGMGFDRREARVAVDTAAKALAPDGLTGEEYERAVLTGAMKLIGENKA